ncbi:MAG: CoB--CoM heterodisulfide reductase iron-sulfur subunit A family protein [Acidobacteriota bacterium]
MARKKKTDEPAMQTHEETRIGVFVCHCGSNIAGYLDCEAVTGYAATLPGVVYAKNNLYTCSEAGIAEIRNGIVEHRLNRVVVASCSPRTHMPLFKSACAQAGLNPYLFEMVNIRDQCSWVHMQEREAGTQKAMDLIRMGVAKAAFLEPQQDFESSLVRRALVIGGGIAGLSAAEALADMGMDVVLVEKEARLGGLLLSLNRIGPRGGDAQEMIAPLIGRVEAKKNVSVRLESQVSAVGGYIGNYEVAVKGSDGSEARETVGCIVVATGALPLKPENLFGYDGKTVITQMELEERLKNGTFDASRVVMVQCAGARSAEREYCSRICCLTAVKNAMLIRERNPEAKVSILYRDMQMYGSENERLLWESRRRGVRYDVYDAERPPVVKPGSVEFNQPLTGEVREIACDLVVLSTPLVAREDAPTLSQLMRIPVDQNRFFLEAHAKLRPLDFSTDGIFVCGSARYPATSTEARAQGLGAASRAATVLFKEKLVSSALVAEIDPKACVGCRGCLSVCPFGAINYSAQEKICRVNNILCKGCGSCAATCPSQSVKLKGFTPKQLLSQVKAVLSGF